MDDISVRWSVVEAIGLGCGEQYWQQVAVMACNGCIKEIALGSS